MWPPTKIGHEFFPKYVYEDEVNDENDLLQSNSRKNGNTESVISMKTLSLSPKVFLIENFLSEDEIEYLVNYGKKHLVVKFMNSKCKIGLDNDPGQNFEQRL